MENVLTRVDIPGFDWQFGKVRDRARVNSTPPALVMVATDRISAFDVVLPTPIPDKGRILNGLTIFWKNLFAGIAPHDIISVDPEIYLPYLNLTPQSEWAALLAGRTVLVKMAERVPVECVVRGYISGSLWKEYCAIRGKYSMKSKVSVLGHELPGNLIEAGKLPQPIFTPAIKSENGHDTNLSFEGLVDYLESWLVEQPEIKKQTSPVLLAQLLKSISLVLYFPAEEYAEMRGLIIADTKLEFGLISGELTLIDEVFTPDSSRFWALADYQPGRPQNSYDKQPVRDWLEASGWNQEPPAPELPQEIVLATTERYREAERRLIGGVPK